jgi:hypothetical protein
MGAGASSAPPLSVGDKRRQKLEAKKKRSERVFPRYAVQLVSGDFHPAVPMDCMLQIETETLALVSEDGKVRGRGDGGGEGDGWGGGGGGGVPVFSGAARVALPRGAVGVGAFECASQSGSEASDNLYH